MIFFPVSLNLHGRKCVVIGNDEEAERKSSSLREAGALVVRIADPEHLDEAKLHDAFFVISTPQDSALSARLRALADRHHFLFCAIDQPQHGFVAMTAVAKAGPARIAISTGGVAPRVGKKLRIALQRVMDEKFARFVDCLAALRVRARRRYPDSPPARRKAMIGAAEGFDVHVELRYPPWFEEAHGKELPRPS